MEDSQLINGIYIDGNLIKNTDKTFTILETIRPSMQNPMLEYLKL